MGKNPWLMLGMLLLGAIIFAACSIARASTGSERATVIPTATVLSVLPSPTSTPNVPSPTPVVKETEENGAKLIASAAINALIQEAHQESAEKTPLSTKLSMYEKARVDAASFTGTSIMTIKVCGKDEICVGFAIELHLQEGEWRIYEVKEAREEHFARSGIHTTTAGPIQTISTLFFLLAGDGGVGASDLFAKKAGTSTIGVSGVVRTIKPLSPVSTVEVLYEDTREEVKGEGLLWNPRENSVSFTLRLHKVNDGSWMPFWIQIGDRLFRQ